MSSTYGIKTQRADGSVMIDGLTRGGVFVEILTLPQGNSSTKSYPDTSGSSLYFYTAVAGSHTVSVGTDVNGAGCINWTATAGSNGSSRIYVFASKVVTSTTYGIKVVNDQNETLADQGYPAPQYLGNVTLGATSTSNYATPDGYTAHNHVTSAFTLQDSSDKFVLMAMPDSGTDDTWYAMQQNCIAAGSGSVSLQVTVYTKSSTYAIPTLHVYGVNNPAPSSSTYGIQLKTAAQALTWDSSVESVSIRDALTIAYPTSGGSTVSYALAVTSLPGVSIPYYYRMDKSGSVADAYVGVAKKVGSQVTFGLIRDTHQNPAIATISYELASRTGRYCPVVDLSQLGAASTPGAPGGTTYSAPVFTTQPQPQTVNSGASATFTAVASGNPTVSYQWYLAGAAQAGATGTSYTVNNVNSSVDGAAVYCIATNARGSAQSATAHVYMTGGASGGGVPVMTHTQAMTVVSGTNVTLNVSATGDPIPGCYIFMPNSSGNSTIVGSGTGSASGSVVLTATTTFNFVAYNSAGSASEYVTITVTGSGGGGGGNTAPNIISSSPPTESVTYGDAVTFSMSATGTPTPTCSIIGPQGSIASGSGSASTTITALDTNAGNYTFSASNSVSTVTRTMTLSVNTSGQAPAITSYSPNGNTSVNSGDTVNFSMGASGTSVQCQISGPQGVLATSYGSASAAVSITSANAGTYTFSASNGYGSDSRSISISVGTAAPTAPVISQNPAPVQVVQDGPATMSCVASPATGYWWYRDGVYQDNVQTLTLDTHTVGSFSYQCVVHNGSTTTPSSTATLTVTAPPAATYQTYNAISGSVEQDFGAPATWSINRGGGTDTGAWANGAGDGTLYAVSASLGAHTTGPTSVDFASAASTSWQMNAPSTVGARYVDTLRINVYLKSTGQSVSSGSITLIAQNGGVQQ